MEICEPLARIEESTIEYSGILTIEGNCIVVCTMRLKKSLIHGEFKGVYSGKHLYVLDIDLSGFLQHDRRNKLINMYCPNLRES